MGYGRRRGAERREGRKGEGEVGVEERTGGRGRRGKNNKKELELSSGEEV